MFFCGVFCSFTHLHIHCPHHARKIKKNMSQPLRNNSDFSCFVSPLLVLQILQTESTIRASRDRTLGEVRQDVQPVVYLFLNEQKRLVSLSLQTSLSRFRVRQLYLWSRKHGRRRDCSLNDILCKYLVHARSLTATSFNIVDIKKINK